MNLNQTKLTKAEWDSIEIPVSPQEKEILKMIQQGYHNVDIRYNGTISLLGFLKVKDSESMTAHLFNTYILPEIKVLNTKYEIDENLVSKIYKKVEQVTKKSKKTKQINKADVIRLNNSMVSLAKESAKDNIFEFVLLNELEKVLDFIEQEKYYDALTPIYTINTLIGYDIYGFNPIFKLYLNELWSVITSKVTPQSIVSRASQIFEQNPLLLQYADQTLYKHQKKIFTIMKRPGKKLVLYTAPTGTGKTMTPIGLAEGKKVIFVCAARHVGLALAKSALSVGRKIAFAFGCETASDVKLHYAAATDYIKDWKTGGIRKVDNSVGDKVEMIISDVQSYLPAMYYMMAFNENVDDIVMYWDEPTITMDYQEHELHKLISKTWRENVVTNIVLSSATLPQERDIDVFMNNVRSNGFEVYNVSSQDFKKTIPVLDQDNYVSMPHMVAKNADELVASAEHCLTHNSIMRYIDVGEAARFILIIRKHMKQVASKERMDGNSAVRDSNGNGNDNTKFLLNEAGMKNKSLVFDNVFPDIKSVTLNNIKTYYCQLLKHINPQKEVDSGNGNGNGNGNENGNENENEEKCMALNMIQMACKSRMVPRYKSSNRLTTTDAHTITDGPALYLTNDVEKVAISFLEEADISKTQMKKIMDAINRNNDINEKIANLQRELEDKLKLNEVKEKKADITNRQLDADARAMLRTIDNLQGMVKVVSLDDSYIPNKNNHIRKYSDMDNSGMDNSGIGSGNVNDKRQERTEGLTTSNFGKPFCSDIPEGVVEEIMLINGIEDSWKILLMMGIGVFAHGLPVEYMEIMKDLADTQQLFLIIASTDYIYGTNYQFCHGFIGDDLTNLTQEKCIQALGRIGRNKLQYNYSVRFKDSMLLEKLFFDDPVKPEAGNMNKLFSFDKV